MNQRPDVFPSNRQYSSHRSQTKNTLSTQSVGKKSYQVHVYNWLRNTMNESVTYSQYGSHVCINTLTHTPCIHTRTHSHMSRNRIREHKTLSVVCVVAEQMKAKRVHKSS